MSSCCGGKCGCGSNCGCGSGCSGYSSYDAPPPFLSPFPSFIQCKRSDTLMLSKEMPFLVQSVHGKASYESIVVGPVNESACGYGLLPCTFGST